MPTRQGVGYARSGMNAKNYVYLYILKGVNGAQIRIDGPVRESDGGPRIFNKYYSTNYLAWAPYIYTPGTQLAGQQHGAANLESKEDWCTGETHLGRAKELLVQEFLSGTPHVLRLAKVDSETN
eukprot:gene7079-5015_t